MSLQNTVDCLLYYIFISPVTKEKRNTFNKWIFSFSVNDENQSTGFFKSTFQPK